jgi:PhnB protein
MIRRPSSADCGTPTSHILGSNVTDPGGQRMNRVSTYLNFMGNTEEAFAFYRSVFGTEYIAPVTRIGDMPADPNMSPLSEAEQRMVMHVELPILGGHVLMATDLLESQGHQLRTGNNVTINLELDDRAEAERLFGLLSEGGSDLFGLQDMPWGAYWGTCADRFGVRWMFNCSDAGA